MFARPDPCFSQVFGVDQPLARLIRILRAMQACIEALGARDTK